LAKAFGAHQFALIIGLSERISIRSFFESAGACLCKGADPKSDQETTVSIEDRIPQLTDKELENLHDNAERIAKGAASKQQAEAARLLPIIADALVERKKTRATEAAEKKVVRQKDMADARAKKAAARKAAKAEEASAE
jgi:hypothetical protein